MVEVIFDIKLSVGYSNEIFLIQGRTILTYHWWMWRSWMHLYLSHMHMFIDLRWLQIIFRNNTYLWYNCISYSAKKKPLKSNKHDIKFKLFNLLCSKYNENIYIILKYFIGNRSNTYMYLREKLVISSYLYARNSCGKVIQE